MTAIKISESQVQENLNNITDTDRLNFLSLHPEYRLVYYKKRWSLVTFTNYDHAVFKSLRDAIDSMVLEQLKTIDKSMKVNKNV